MIETRTGDREHGRGSPLDTGISWVRAHIGIRGNELADQHATFQSYKGEIAGAIRTATEGGIRRIAKEARANERKAAGYGKGDKVQWGWRALTAYFWLRTGKGPQRQWLHKIGKAEDPSCPCAAAVQSGEHIVWQCNLLLGGRRWNRVEGTRGWEDLDGKIWVPAEGEGEDDEENQVDGIERFFNYLAYQF